MSILSTVKKGYMTIKTASGYVKLLPRTLATLVAMSDGKSVEDKINELNGKLGYTANVTTVTLNGWTVQYQNAGAGYIYVHLVRTVQQLGNGSAYTEITNLPFTVAFVQWLPITNLVANAVIGNGTAKFEGKTLICRYEGYTAPVTNEIAGLLRAV